jgi:CRP/FNR family transcriptional regulator, cyclic AMP receptor protein
VQDSNFLRGVPLFIEFEPDELDAIAEAMLTFRYSPGDLILEEGNPNRALHILKSGQIRVSRRVHDREVTLCELQPGQSFGELSIIEDGVASASLRAVTEGEVLSIPMDKLAAFLRRHPNAAAKFWRAVAIDLRRRLLQTNEVVRNYFEVNRALIENPVFRETYAMANR